MNMHGERRKLFLDDNQKVYEEMNISEGLNAVKGYIIYSFDKNSCYIDYIEVDNNEKNQGEGTKLLNKFIKNMKSKNIDNFYLEALITKNSIFDLKTLICFYEKFGFKEYDRFEDDILRIYMSLKF